MEYSLNLIVINSDYCRRHLILSNIEKKRALMSSLHRGFKNYLKDRTK